MLRFEYMPSDFNPLFLFLGESEDFAALAGTLRRFATSPATVDIGGSLTSARSNSHLSLVPEGGENGNYGLKQGEDGTFCWRLNAWQAQQIATRIKVLVPVENRSGSDIIELGSEGEIPVKISRGEFEDDFLISKF